MAERISKPSPPICSNFRRSAVYAAAALLLLGGSLTPSDAQDDDPVLKPDFPKLDLSMPMQNRRLKGGVQHNESGSTNSAKRLSASAGTLTGKAKEQQKEQKLSASTPKLGVFNKMFHVKTTRAPLNSAVQASVGIIGVKFSLGFGRPPIINRVFPGTPAHVSGLRVDDIIVAVDGVPTNGLTKDEVYGMIVGTPQTTVTLSVLRNGDFLARTMQRMDFNDIMDPIVKRDYMTSL